MLIVHVGRSVWQRGYILRVPPLQDVVGVDIHGAVAASARLLVGREGRAELPVSGHPSAERHAALRLEVVRLHLLRRRGADGCDLCLEDGHLAQGGPVIQRRAGAASSRGRWQNICRWQNNWLANGNLGRWGTGGDGREGTHSSTTRLPQ
jgi:hypothetical protein